MLTAGRQMNAAATALATIATCGAMLLVFLLFAPSLQASFLVPKFAALELTASLGLVACALQRTTNRGARWSRPVAIGAVLVLASSAVAWLVAAGRAPGAPYAVAAMARWGSLFGLACGASAVDDAPDSKRRILETITIAAATVAAIGLLQHFEALPLRIPVISKPGSTFGNRNAAAEVMAMTLPLGLGAAAGARRLGARRLILVALALELVFLAVTRARGAWIGAACGLGAAMLLHKPQWSRASLPVALGAIVAGALLVAAPVRFNPYDVGDHKRYSGVVEVLQDGLDARTPALKTRFGLWQRTIAMVRDYPIFGVGPGNWPVFFPRYAEPHATRDGVLSATLAPRQTHNDLLERAAESGIPGLISLGVLAAGATIAVRRRLRSGDANEHATTAAAAGALVSLVGLSATSFPLEMPGTLAVAGLALGLIAAETPALGSARASHDFTQDGLVEAASASPRSQQVERARASHRPIAYASVAVGLALFFCAAVRAERSVRNSRWLGIAERTLHQDRGPGGAADALRALRFALAATPDDYRAQLRAAQMLLRQGDAAESARAAARALTLEPYAPNAWAALAAAELARGNAEAARMDSARALGFLSDFPFALHLRALAADTEGDAAAAESDREHLRLLAAGADDDDTARAARELLRSAPAGEK
jgi:O-antigen ligase